MKKMCLYAAVLLIVVGAFALAACGRKVSVVIYITEENEDGTITITGLSDYGRNKAELNVPDTINGKKVTAIGNEAFRADTMVEKLVIADGITSIGDNAFLSCYALADIEIPESVTSIGTNVFTDTAWEKNMLKDNKEIVVHGILVKVSETGTEYNVPEGVKKIGSGVFYNNRTIEKIGLPDSLEEIGTYAISGCDSLKEIVIPSNVSRIRYCAFADCGIEVLNIPATVGVIEKDAFLNVERVVYTGYADGRPWGAKAIGE